MKGIMESILLGGLSHVWAGSIFVYFKANWKSSRSGVEAVHRQFWEGGGTLISLYSEPRAVDQINSVLRAL